MFENVCIPCNGSGTQTVQGQELTSDGWKDLAPVELKCIWCDGTGELTPAQKQALEDYFNMWCRCEGETGAEYVPDTPFMKHHWDCTTCGKVKQIG